MIIVHYEDKASKNETKTVQLALGSAFIILVTDEKNEKRQQLMTNVAEENNRVTSGNYPYSMHTELCSI